MWSIILISEAGIYILTFRSDQYRTSNTVNMQSSSRVIGNTKRPKIYESGIFNSRQLWNRFKLFFATRNRKFWEAGMSVFAGAYSLMIGRRNGRAQHDGAIECSEIPGVGSIGKPCMRRTAGSVPEELTINFMADLIHLAGRGLRKTSHRMLEFRALQGVWFPPHLAYPLSHPAYGTIHR